MLGTFISSSRLIGLPWRKAALMSPALKRLLVHAAKLMTRCVPVAVAVGQSTLKSPSSRSPRSTNLLFNFGSTSGPPSTRSRACLSTSTHRIGTGLMPAMSICSTSFLDGTLVALYLTQLVHSLPLVMSNCRCISLVSLS